MERNLIFGLRMLARFSAPTLDGMRAAQHGGCSDHQSGSSDQRGCQFSQIAFDDIERRNLEPTFHKTINEVKHHVRSVGIHRDVRNHHFAKRHFGIP